jgi:hypothetical protein
MPRRPDDFMPSPEPHREGPAPLSPFMPPDTGVSSPLTGCVMATATAALFLVLGLAKSCNELGKVDLSAPFEAPESVD